MPSFNQNALIKKLNVYLKSKNRKSISEEGYCHGLTLLWLQRMSEHDENNFYEFIKEFILCNESDFTFLETCIERFLSHIEWLQNSTEYLSDINQFDVDKLLEFPKKMSFSAVFNYRDLTQILELTVLPEKMICISDQDHTIGIFCRNNEYHLYDANYLSGKAVIIKNNISSLQNEIINRLFIQSKPTPLHKFPLLFNIMDSPNSKNTNQYAIDKKAIVQLLTNSTSKIFREDASGTDSLFLASKNNDVEMVNILVEKIAKTDRENPRILNALSIACEQGYYEITKILLKYHENPQIADQNGNTLLHDTAQHGHDHIITLLLSHPKFKIDIQNNAGETSLYSAIRKDKFSSIKLLLDSHANPLHFSNKKVSPLGLASRQKSWLSCLLLLIKIKNISLISNSVWDQLALHHQQLQDLLQHNLHNFSFVEIAHLTTIIKNLHAHSEALAKKNEPIHPTLNSYQFFTFPKTERQETKKQEEEDDETLEPQFCIIL